MRTLKKPEVRKSEILDAAEALFLSKGYAQVAVNDVLQAVGIAKGTFYHHFKSKEEVMDAIIDRFIESLALAAREIASDPDLGATEKLFRIVTANPLDTPRKERLIEQLHSMNNAEMHQKSLVETVRHLTPVLTEVIEQGIKEGLFKVPYPKEVVEFLLTSSQFLLDVEIFRWSSVELLEKARAFAWIVETLLGAEKESFAYIAERHDFTSLPDNTAVFPAG